MATTPCVLVEDQWGTVITRLPHPSASFDDELIARMWAHEPWSVEGRMYRIAAIDLIYEPQAEQCWTRVRVEAT